jgi:hypothetical protein
MNPIVSGFWRAFYSKTFYRQVARSQGIEPFAYLLALTGLCGAIFLACGFGAVLSQGALSTWEDFVSQAPVIHILNGEASVDGPQPAFVKVRNHGQEGVVAVLDTHDQIQAPDRMNTPIYLHSHELIMFDKGKIDHYSLARIKHMTIDHARIRHYARLAMFLMFIVPLPIAFGGFFIYLLVKSLLYACSGFIGNFLFKVHLGFRALWAISTVAVTPASILLAILYFFQSIRLPSYLFVLLTFAYVVFGIYANSLPDATADDQAKNI